MRSTSPAGTRSPTAGNHLAGPIGSQVNCAHPGPCPKIGGGHWGQRIPLLTFLLGCLALLGWLYVTGADEISRSILRRGAKALLLLPGLFAIPAFFLFQIGQDLLPEHAASTFSYLFWLVGAVLFEEIFKQRASRLAGSGIQIFALVSLFGIFELAFLKPLYFLGLSASEPEAFVLQLLLLPAVAMHFLTAAIYAFHLRQRPALQFSVCAAIHIAFNLAADASAALPDWLWIASIVPLLGGTFLLVPKRGEAHRGNWGWRPEEANRD